MKYKHLIEIINTYWGKLSYSGKNLTTLLIAFEVASELPVVPANTVLDFNGTWGNQIEEAKDRIREIHKVSVGFEPWDVLEQVRIIQEYRCASIRMVSHFYGGSIPYSIADRTLELNTNEDTPVQWSETARDVILHSLANRRTTFSMLVQDIDSAEANVLMNNHADEVDRLVGTLGGGSDSKTVAQMSYEQKCGEDGGVIYTQIIALANTLNFKRYSTFVVSLFIKGILDELDIPEEYREHMTEAVTRLVEG